MPKTNASFRPRVWAMVGGAVALALAIVAFDPYLFTGGDNAQYYALTHALGGARRVGRRGVRELLSGAGHALNADRASPRL